MAGAEMIAAVGSGFGSVATTRPVAWGKTLGVLQLSTTDLALLHVPVVSLAIVCTLLGSQLCVPGPFFSWVSSM